MPTEFFLLGAGGHGKVVLDALYACGNSVRVFDADAGKAGTSLLNNTIYLLSTDLAELPECGHVAVGDNAVRRRVTEEFLSQGKSLLTVLHPHAVVAPSASVADGCFIAAAAVVGPEASLAEGCIINHGAVIDHDAQIGGYCHIAPNVTLGGQVVVGEEVLIGSGAVVLPGIRIGKGARIGAGAVVTRDVEAGQIVIGIPARSRE